MKISSVFCLRRLLLFTVALWCRAAIADAKPAAIAATLAPIVPASTEPIDAEDELPDFKWLTFIEHNHQDGVWNSLNVSDGLITFTSNTPQYSKSEQFTPAEHRALFGVLRMASLNNLVGSYDERDRFEGLRQNLSVGISGGAPARSFEISNYGDKAPPGYYKIVRYLRDLRSRKFPDYHFAPAWTPPPPVEHPTDFVDNACLTYRAQGSFYGGSWTLRIRGRTIHLTSHGHSGFDLPVRFQTAVLSEAEWANLNRVMQDSECFELPGTFLQGNLYDGQVELLTLSPGPLYDSRNTIVNYGDLAPPGYLKVRRYLAEMRNRIFPEPSVKSTANLLTPSHESK